MSSLKNVLLRLWPFKTDTTDSHASQCGRKTETRKITRVLGPWESYMVSLQSILIWERPGTSAAAVVTVNVLFWLVVWSELRVYFVLSVAALGVFLHQQWVHSIWPEIRVPKPEPDDSEDWTPVHPSVLSVPEISQYVEVALRWIRENYTWLLQLRRHQPALFCAIMTTVLSLCGVVGYLVPGVVLVYNLLMLAMTGPGIFLHVLPDSFYERLSRMRAALRGDTAGMETSHVSLDSDISEFMPELQSLEAQAALDVPLMSQDPLEVEQTEEAGGKTKNGGGASARRRKGRKGSPGDDDSIASRVSGADDTVPFYTGLPEDFPSYDHDSVDDLDDPDIDLPEPCPPVPKPSIQRHPGNSSDRYQMEFVSSHFGESSDEEEAFMEGLSFEQRGQLRAEPQYSPQAALQSAPAVDPIGQLMSSVIAQNAGNVLSAFGQNLVTSVIGQASGVNSQIPHTVSRETSHHQPPPRMSRSMDSQQQSTTDLEDDFELISDEECQ
ncbi:reticulophagy regulator 3-like [Portunus trituberculatus]|uniref:reticulophagy regulator 3-like n=1 Tax=Portunus trituberculatus TaxID=210409 RepID=UPI001E1CE21C|nr:reticulophagy regulator 3-like [Portunus trituberculatus]